ncbi:MAG: 5-(carboxyamino)imidazole ribonucleotide synthase [Bacteroidetes bacterium]|nr:5-(carboxyamino)imidazole ribonucleotide synthase [Bacteroidota bacterium]
MIKPGKIIGIIGNGQLGRMSAIEAKKMGYTVYVYGPGTETPAGQVSDIEVEGDYDDIDKLKQFAHGCDVLTFEFENIPAISLEAIRAVTPIHPDPFVLEISQNRLGEKNWFEANGFPTTPFEEVKSASEIGSVVKKWKSKAVVKTLTLGYDGKGQAKVDLESDFQAVWKQIGVKSAIIEKWVEFDHEISVIVARNESGEIVTYPVFENIHRNHILDTTIFPARMEKDIKRKAREMAKTMAEKIKLIGLLTIEMFLTADGQLLINEIAPRPHNSGHITFDVCATSQFQQHIRAICGLPLGNTEPYSPGIMVNILGDSWNGGEPNWKYLLSMDFVNLHLYGKMDPKPGRKMGHVVKTNPGTDFSDFDRIRQILKIPPVDL